MFVSNEVKRGLRNSILLLLLTCGLENWMWKRVQQSRVHCSEMSYLRGACRVAGWDSENSEDV